MGNFIFGVIVCMVILNGCQPDLEQRDDYKAGYASGYNDGVFDGKASICRKLSDYNQNIGGC